MPPTVPRVVIRSRLTVSGFSQDAPGSLGYPMAVARRGGTILAVPLERPGFIPAEALWEEHAGEDGTFAYVQQADGGPVALLWSGDGQRVTFTSYTPGNPSQQWRKVRAGDGWIRLAQEDGEAYATLEPIPDPELTAPVYTQATAPEASWQQWRTLYIPDPLRLSPEAVRALFGARADA